MSTTPPATNTTASASAVPRWKTLVGTGIGNALEWYDWNVYAVFTPFFAAQFFRSSDPTSALLSSLAVFAVGFLMRPLGGLLFGWLADRTGRRAAMTTSIACAAIGSLVIGFSPTYTTVGVGASAILVIARLGQGLAHGGELPAAQTYISEMAPHGRRGRWSSLIYVSGTCGVTLGTLVGAVLASVLSEGALHEWGWRIPFVLGGFLGLYALLLRRQLSETEVFEQHRSEASEPNPGLWRGMWRYRVACLRVIGLTVGATVVYYTWAVSAPAYAISVKGVDEKAALWVGVFANVVFIVMLPLFGILSDRVGRKPLVYFATLGLAVATIPLNKFIDDQAWKLAVAMFVAMTIMAAYSSIGPALYAEMFPTHLRAAGVGFPYSVAVALCGGTAPYLQTWLADTGGEDWFLYYTVALLLLTFLVALRIPETKDVELT
jgi:MHS family alpha-ketoglutarate permease-like MFS transporter